MTINKVGSFRAQYISENVIEHPEKVPSGKGVQQQSLSIDEMSKMVDLSFKTFNDSDLGLRAKVKSLKEPPVPPAKDDKGDKSAKDDKSGT